MYEAVLNAPWVVNISLPESILVGFPVYPEQFKTQNTTNNGNIFNWFRGLTINEKGNEISDMHIKWELVSTSFVYIPSIQDIGQKLKIVCIPGNDGTQGPAVEAVSKTLVEAGPGKCPFEDRHKFTTNLLYGKSFRCVTYNILADLYCDSDYTRTVLHPYCPPYALHIDYRKQLIIKELLGYNADIICLQEVDNKIFQHCLKPTLECEGYNGQFYKKGKDVAEGLSCFYRSERFSYLGGEEILISKMLPTETCLQPIWNVIQDNEPLKQRLLDRSTVANATFLQSNDNCNEILIVGNTHLYFHPDADHIRLIQGGTIIYWLQDIKKKMQIKYPDKRVSLILSGDFNSVPSCGIYQLYCTGEASSTLPDWKSNLNEAVEGLHLKQSIPLASACGTPEYTNFTDGFADCLDYIFYETSNLDVIQVVPFPSTEELKAHTALPSIVFPSDHIALISDLQFK
ncbi:hypothetical protein K1T71_002497 [Dendrolimus kikuchii]|uniref:Uncharacterized protein n=1 Tax=Dendrolimus kikuchii TaxID=765133 RepID=A0ACC1DD63_9NEOP|nr:hypothetical protein K1T71_002497 [Dendrolimus kikuchii]